MSLKETLLHSKNYITISFANEGLKFISIPVLTYLLSPSDYGIINIFSTWVTILSILTVLNLNGAISRYFYEYTEDFKEFVGTSIFISLGLFAVSGLAILIFNNFFADLLELPSNAVIFLAPVILFQVINLIFLQIYQPLKDSKRIRNYSIPQVYIGFALTVILIWIRGEDLYLGRLQSILLVTGAFTIIKIRDIMKYTKLVFKKKFVRYIASFSIPNIPYLLSGVILSQFDRIFINHHMGASEAGLYSFAYNIGMLQLMASSAIHKAWTPKYYEYMKDDDQDSMAKDINFFARLVTAISISLILFGKFLGMILSAKSFHASLYMIPWIVAGHFFVGLSPFNKNAIIYSKKTYITAMMTLGAGVLNIVLNAWLIPIYGSIAAALTTLVCFALLFFVEYGISRYTLKLNNIEFKTYIKPIITMVLCCLIYFQFIVKIDNIFIEILVDIGVLFGFVWFLFKTELVHEWKAFRKR